MPSDAELMSLALRLARRAEGRVEPNPMVGCVLTRNGKIIGRHRSTGIGRPRFWDRAKYFGLEKELAQALDEAEAA